MDDTLLPKEDIDKLKKEIEILKKRPSLDREEIYNRVDQTDDTKEIMLSLTKSMNSLIRIFKEASQEMKIDSHDAVLVSDKIDKLMQKVDKLEIQNEKIAKGIVAVADMLEELKQRLSYRPIPVQMQSQMPQMQMPINQPQVQPKPLPGYPVPQQEEKKKGFSFKI